jgi:carboxyl-terminal processing protease
MKKSLVAVLLAATALGTAAVTSQVTARTGAANTSETYRYLNLFGDVFERVRADYVEEVSDKQLIEAAINGMLTSLDPHSSYLDKESFGDMQVQTRGEFGGLGIEVTMEQGVVKVVSPMDETPAAKAGLQPGDYITHLNDEPVMGLSLSEAVEKMRGPIGSDIKITVRRGLESEPFDVKLTRDRIEIKAVRSRVQDNIGYIRITSFTEKTQPGLEAAITQIKTELGDKLIGYVLDLRNNPGGLLDQAVSVSDAFLNQGEIVSTRGRHDDDAQRWNAKAGDIANAKPIVVLINGGSASASEIVAGALQDHRRAIVLGTQSFGKGSVQTVVRLPGEGAMRLTTARYYTPSGRSIQKLGITPDIEVKPARIEELAGIARREADLKGALANPNQPGGAPNAAPAAPVQTPPQAAPTPAPAPGAQAPAPNGTNANAAPAAAPTPVDYQLARAIDLLRGVSLFGTKVVN